jgi:hypothetical protein
MGAVFRKTFTKPVPPESECFVRKGIRYVRWKDHKERIRTAALITTKSGAERILFESPFFFAKYRDGSGIVRVVSTGCR